QGPGSAAVNERDRARSRDLPAARRRSRRAVAGQSLAVVAILIVLCGGLWALNRFSRVPAGAQRTGMAGDHPVQTGGNELPGAGNAAPAGGAGPGAGNQGGLISPDNSAGGTPGDNSAAGAAPGSGGLSEGGNGVTGADGTGPDGNLLNGTKPAAGQVQLVPGPFAHGSQSFTVKGPGPLTVQMSASDRCWVQVTADGQSVDGAGGEIVTAGAPKQWQAQHSLTIRIGNVPVASLTVNGLPVPMPPTSAPVNLTFTKQ
ncbi:MAG: DUF4115 domain-containing protein, partial [Alicyclobacillus sp.]|nr:DUF4115 domain-containing protein [Alicyclobacillus sp.]